MKKIIIGASKNNAIGSKLIQWWMGTPYSHVYAKWYLSDQERNIIYHAARSVVHFRCCKNFAKDNIIVKEIEIELTDEQFKKFSSKCIDLAGEPYSKLELLQIVLCDISGGRLTFQDQRGYICSELIYELLQDLGITINKPKYLVRPDDIIKALEVRYESKQV